MYKNIILDLGGVILNVDYNRLVESFASYGVKDFDKIYTQKNQVDIIDRFEEGKCSIEEFRDGIRELVKMDLSDSQIDNAWYSMILDLPKERIQLLGILKLKYNLFSKAYLSNEIKRRKPHSESFSWVCNDAGILPEETLFIEDTLHHIEGAKKMGLNTYWLTNGESLIDLYDKKII